MRGGRDSEGDRSAWPEELVAADLQALQRRRARDAAEEAELILALAGRRPATADPSGPGARRPGWTADGEPEISEFFLAELSALLNLGRGTASHRLGRALTWTRKLPATFAELRAGRLDERRADALADVLAHTSREIAGQVEDALLSEARDLSVHRLRDRAAALMLQLDTAAAEEQRAAAERAADVHVHPTGTPGRSTLAADLPTDEAVECHDLVDQLARMLKADGDERPIGVLRAYVLSALIRRPADSGLPPVSADVRITAGLDSLTGADTEPGEVNGLPITAAHLRELLARVGALGLTAPEGGTLTFAVTGPDGQLLATTTPAELARLARRGCTAHPDGDSERGGDDRAAHAGGRAETSCGCPVLGPPAATDSYAPTDKQRAFVTTRDQRCRFPNCGQRVGWADLDHVHAHGDGGTTDCTNLCCLCRSHHRLKTFAPGWRFRLDDEGTLRVTTPSGVTRTTRPPGLRRPAESPPGLPRPVEFLHETPAPPIDDPPPF
ncbi:HNH endonuclease signature motif containing protein [Modestobacter sp. L9-4]|uniref:HNH endonuclease signature motif containing protein n=1 Tax=Modestobacter sp. L9-4 TaxID=2851567 RepID=UPI001F286FC8|nr:HNH endonuclease signature motif containing protein [Modestobacter sp. L9-4]